MYVWVMGGGGTQKGLCPTLIGPKWKTTISKINEQAENSKEISGTDLAPEGVSHPAGAGGFLTSCGSGGAGYSTGTAPHQGTHLSCRRGDTQRGPAPGVGRELLTPTAEGTLTAAGWCTAARDEK